MTVFFSADVEVAVSSCCIIFCCLSLFWLFLLFRFRHTSVIKAHSYAFLSLSVFGSLLSLLSVFSWPLDSPSILCSVRPWLFTLPFYLLFCPLLAKHYRIHRIFNISTLIKQKWGVSDQHVGMLTFSLIVPQIIINIVWIVNAPLQPIAITVPSSSIIHDCHASSSSVIFLWLSVAYLCCLLLASIYLTFRLRHLADEFNQSKDILSCTLFIIGAAAVIIALQLTSKTDYNYRYCIRSFGVMGILVIWQLLLIIPKMRMIWKEKEGGGGELQVGQAGKGIARLRISPHSLKQVASACHSVPTTFIRKDTTTGKDISKGQVNHSAMSSTTTLISPTEEKEKESQQQQNTQPSDIHLTIQLPRQSVSQDSTAVSVLSKSGRGALKSHLRSKSQMSGGSWQKVNARDDKLPSLKQMKAGMMNTLSDINLNINGSNLSPSSRNAKGSVRGGGPGGRGKSAGDGYGSSVAFKTNLEDHISPLYTPPAITVEQVPIFMSPD